MSKEPFRPREVLIERQNLFQSIHKHTYLRGPFDKITSVAFITLQIARLVTVLLLKSASMQIICKSFANRNGLTHKGGKMVIKDGGGRSWEVSLIDDTRSASLGRGWVDVIRANRFKHEDVLKFQLIKNGNTPVMKVTGNFNSFFSLNGRYDHTNSYEIFNASTNPFETVVSKS